jgi:hypothetical protein
LINFVIPNCSNGVWGTGWEANFPPTGDEVIFSARYQDEGLKTFIYDIKENKLRPVRE